MDIWNSSLLMQIQIFFQKKTYGSNWTWKSSEHVISRHVNSRYSVALPLGKNLCPSYSQSVPHSSSTHPSAFAGTLDVCIARLYEKQITAKIKSNFNLIVRRALLLDSMIKSKMRKIYFNWRCEQVART